MKRGGKIDNGGAESPDRRLTHCMQVFATTRPLISATTTLCCVRKTIEETSGGDKSKDFGFYGPFKNISVISSRSFIRGGRKLEYPVKNHLTYR